MNPAFSMFLWSPRALPFQSRFSVAFPSQILFWESMDGWEQKIKRSLMNLQRFVEAVFRVLLATSASSYGLPTSCSGCCPSTTHFSVVAGPLSSYRHSPE